MSINRSRVHEAALSDPSSSWRGFISVQRSSPFFSQISDCATQEFHPGFNLSRTDHDPQPLDVVIRQEPSVVVGFQPVEEMNLIQVRAHEFFSQFVRLAACPWRIDTVGVKRSDPRSAQQPRTQVPDGLISLEVFPRLTGYRSSRVFGKSRSHWCLI